MLGPKNPAVHELRRLLSSRRHRREQQRFAIEGPELLIAALDAGWVVERAFVDPERVSNLEIGRARSLAQRSGVAVDELAPGVLEKVADAATPQGCAAIVVGAPGPLAELGTAHFVVVLDTIQDPGNLGAVVRVAEAAGADALVLTGSSADPFGPKALRGSTGSSFRMPIFEHPSARVALEDLKGRGLAVALTSPHDGVDFAAVAWPDSVALVLGNEANGLDAELIAAGDLVVTIPMAPGVESLNLSVSAGILAMGVARDLRARRGVRRGSTIAGMETEGHR